MIRTGEPWQPDDCDDVYLSATGGLKPWFLGGNNPTDMLRDADRNSAALNHEDGRGVQGSERHNME
jgi:hypothetical protein